jgi:hypothetical protein
MQQTKRRIYATAFLLIEMNIYESSYTITALKSPEMSYKIRAYHAAVYN